MTNQDLVSLRYPIGAFDPVLPISRQQVDEWIELLARFPKNFRGLVSGLSNEQLDTPYRPGGWTVRQLVHHVPDSHVNSYIRFKWALTEDQPIIKAYDEQTWALLADTQGGIDLSLNLLDSIHAKLVNLLRTLSDDQLKRSFIHPENNSQVLLDWNIGNYAWHSQHHYAHIQRLLEREDWL